MTARSFASVSLLLCALLLLPAAVGAQGMPYVLTGEWIVLVDGQPSPKAEIFFAQRARSLVLLVPELPSPVRLGTATREVVSRALERSRIFRASLWAYLRHPERSACPGRGRVTALVSAGSPGSGLIASRQFSQSRFLITSVTGLPMVLPMSRNMPRES